MNDKIKLQDLSDEDKLQLLNEAFEDVEFPEFIQFAILQICKFSAKVNSTETKVSTDADYNSIRYHCEMVVKMKPLKKQPDYLKKPQNILLKQ